MKFFEKRTSIRHADRRFLKYHPSMKHTFSSQAISRLTFQSLRCLESVYHAGNITKASKKLGLAQSALSRHVMDLEDLFGGPLFVRTGRGVRPTLLCEGLMPRVTLLLREGESLTSKAVELSESPTGTVTVGLIPSVAGALAGRIFDSTANKFPRIDLRFYEAYSSDLEGSLTKGSIDLAIINRSKSTKLEHSRVLFDAPLCLVGPCEFIHRVKCFSSNDTGTSKITVADLENVPLILPFLGPGTQKQLYALADLHHIRLNIMVEAASATVIKSILLSHACGSILPRHAIPEELTRGVLSAVAIEGDLFDQHVVLATVGQSELSIAAKAVANLIPAVADAWERPANLHNA